MKRSLFCVGLVLSATPAFAEETGGDSYVGLYAGYSATSPDYSEPVVEYGGSRNPNVQGQGAGFLIGHDFKTKGAYIGIEGDFGMLVSAAAADPNAFNDYTAFKTRWNGHLRARLGVNVGPSTRVYVAGGGAVMNMTTDDMDWGWGITNQTYLGWTAGGGIEQRVNPKLSFRIEYLHDGFGPKSGTIISDYNSRYNYVARMKPDSDTVRVGFAFKL